MSKLLFAVCLIVALSAAQAQKSAELKRYSECPFGKDYPTAQVQEFEGEFDRPVTIGDQSKIIHSMDGYSIYVAYKEDEPFANIKAEQLRAETYDSDKQILIEGLRSMAANTPDLESPTPTKSESNGFEVYGVNRAKLDGNVLSVYLLLNNKTHTSTTVYLLNDDPAQRHFDTLAQFHAMRDEFLKSMLNCFKQ
jgi:hypothetical protein